VSGASFCGPWSIGHYTSDQGQPGRLGQGGAQQSNSHHLEEGSPIISIGGSVGVVVVTSPTTALCMASPAGR